MAKAPAVVEAAPVPVSPVQAIFDRWHTKKPHQEIAEFERGINQSQVQQVANVGKSLNVWDFIYDAIHGTGGFADGSYLIPHKREVSRSGVLAAKFWERIDCADYDDFAKTIHEGPINYIAQAKDTIKRSSEDKRLEAWWSNCDGNGTDIQDFLLGFPAEQARAYGTAWLFLDRPAVPIVSQADAKKPENDVYVRCEPTRNVVWWEFDRKGSMTALVVLEPETEGTDEPCPVRVWTRDSWAVYVPETGPDGKPGKGYTVQEGGQNELGMIPVVRLFDEPAQPKKGMGRSIMLQIARIARTVYNVDSEAREIERKAAFPFLAIPMKNADGESFKKLQVGTDSAVPYDGDGGEPKWITPDLSALDKLAAKVEAKKEAAYAMAHLKAVVGTIKTTSGMHTEAEFDETSRAIGKFAAQFESAETDLGVLYLKFRGVDDVTEALAAFSVSYPREFGLRDMDKLVDRTQKRLNMNLGEDDAYEAILDLYSALYPRRSQVENEEAARKAAGERSKANEEQKATDRMTQLLKAGKPAAPGAPKKEFQPKK